jgi:hypothetical protein
VSDLTDAVAEIRDARPGYEEAESYFRGRAWERFPNPALRRALASSPDVQHAVNFARKPVTAVLERLKLLSATVTGSPGDTDRLAALVKRNELKLEFPEIHEAALTFGDAYVIVWPGAGDQTADGDGPAVDVHYNSPLTVRVFYDEENPRLRRYAAKLWKPPSGRTRVDLYYPDRVEKWVLAENARGKGEREDDWEHFDDGDGGWRVAHAMGEVPVFHYRTRRPYGEPVHVDAYGPQDAITKLVASQLATTDFHAFPQRYATSNATDSLGGFADFGADDDETRAPDPGLSNLKAGPGELWSLRNVDKVGQFPAADVRAFLDPMDFYVCAMAACTGTPLFYFKPQGDAPSGESVRALDVPLAAKTAHIRESLTATHAGMLRCALRAGGAEPAGDVELHWAPIQSINDLVGWQAVQAKIDAGVPTRQALIDAGYSPDQVDEWGYTEHSEIKPKVAVLAQLGAAVQSLGAGVALGVISAGQVERAVSELLGEDAGAGAGDG